MLAEQNTENVGKLEQHVVADTFGLGFFDPHRPFEIVKNIIQMLAESFYGMERNF